MLLAAEYLGPRITNVTSLSVRTCSYPTADKHAHDLLQVLVDNDALPRLARINVTYEVDEDTAGLLKCLLRTRPIVTFDAKHMTLDATDDPFEGLDRLKIGGIEADCAIEYNCSSLTVVAIRWICLFEDSSAIRKFKSSFNQTNFRGHDPMLPFFIQQQMGLKKLIVDNLGPIPVVCLQFLKPF